MIAASVKNRRCSTVLAIFLLVAGLLWASPAAAEVTNEEVVGAIQAHICSRDYWRQGPPRTGRKMPLTVGRQGLWAVAWLDDSEYVPKSIEFSPDRVRDSFPRHSYFFQIAKKFGQPAVMQVHRYGPDDKPPQQIYENDKHMPFEGPVEHTEFVEPTQCPSRLDDSLTKQRIRDAIADATRKQLSAFNRSPVNEKYPRKLQIIVQGFNVDEDFIDIYVPITGEVFRVALHEFDSPYDDEEYVRNKDFPFGQDYRPSRNQISLIQRDGTTHEIQLDD